MKLDGKLLLESSLVSNSLKRFIETQFNMSCKTFQKCLTLSNQRNPKDHYKEHNPT